MNIKRNLGMFAAAAIIVVGGLELGERLAVPGVDSALPSADARERCWGSSTKCASLCGGCVQLLILGGCGNMLPGSEDDR